MCLARRFTALRSNGYPLRGFTLTIPVRPRYLACISWTAARGRSARSMRTELTCGPRGAPGVGPANSRIPGA
jgi:hypothetical protein